MKAAAQKSSARCGEGCPITLDHRLCKACGICVAICPNKVYDRDHLGYPVIARPELCIQCLRCELHCPDFAIEIVRRERKRPATAKNTAAVGHAPTLAGRVLAGAGEHTADAGEPVADAAVCGDEGTG